MEPNRPTEDLVRKLRSRGVSAKAASRRADAARKKKRPSRRSAPTGAGAEAIYRKSREY